MTGGGVVLLKLDSAAGTGWDPGLTSLPSSPMIGAGELPLGQREKARVCGNLEFGSRLDEGTEEDAEEGRKGLGRV